MRYALCSELLQFHILLYRGMKIEKQTYSKKDDMIMLVGPSFV